MGDSVTARGTRAGPGLLLIAIYAVFAISAGARAGVQILSRFTDAPVPFTLSAVAALLYGLITMALYRSDKRSRRFAGIALLVELLGVIVVGAVSLIWPKEFPEATVWSEFGRGYGYLPLALPIVGLLFLRRIEPRSVK
ncbi:MAG: hypothetical protein ACRC0L_07415 [Angustibacter sp.]